MRLFIWVFLSVWMCVLCEFVVVKCLCLNVGLFFWVLELGGRIKLRLWYMLFVKLL